LLNTRAMPPAHGGSSEVRWLVRRGVTTMVRMRSFLPSLPRLSWLVLGAGSLSALANGFVIPFVVVYLHETRGVGLPAVGIVMALVAVVAIAANVVAGIVTDRVGPRRPLVAMLLAGAAGALLLGAVESTWQALLVAAPLGVGITTGWVGLQPLVAAVTPAAARAEAFAVQFALLNAGIGAGGLAGGFVADYDRPRTFALVFAAAAVCWLVFAALLLGPLRRVGNAPLERVRATGGYRVVARDRAFRAVWVMNVFLVATGTAQLDNALPAFAADSLDASPRVLGIVFAANTASIVCGQFVVLRVVRGRRRTRMLAAQGLFWAAAWTLVLSALALGPWILVPAVVVFSIGEMLHAPSIPAIVNDLAPDELRGRYNAAGATSWQTGRIAAAPLAGVVLGLGLDAPLILGFACAALAASAFALRLERRLPPSANGIAPQRAITLAHARPAAAGDPA
jgi:MFS family permease